MILVTGGTGLVGSHLLLNLARSGKKARSLYRTEQSLAKVEKVFSYYGHSALFNTIDWVKGDIIDVPSLEEAFIGIDYVYHCAALISFNPADEEKLRKINIEGTANMVNFALAFGVKKFLYVSSVAALGDPKGESPIITEQTEWNPEVSHSDYALTKHGAEMEVWRAWQEGLSIVIVNPALIFGYGFWDQGSGKIIKAVHKGQHFYTNGSCGVVAVEDVVDIMTILMDSPIAGERFTIAAQNFTYFELFSTIASGMLKKPPYIFASSFITSFIWRLDWLLAKLGLKQRSFSRSIARSAHKKEYFDTSKLDAATKYKFIDMKDYLKNLARLFSVSG